MMEDFADENGIGLFCMSAKNGDQVEACFRAIISILSGIKMDGEPESRVCRRTEGFVRCGVWQIVIVVLAVLVAVR
jgi:hypothetical protein